MRRFCILFALAVAACSNRPVGGSPKAIDVSAGEIVDAKTDAAHCVHSAECPNKTDQCVDGTCTSKVCNAGSKKCDKLNLAVCNSIGLAWVSTSCDDNNPCTLDTCNSNSGCNHLPTLPKDEDGDGFGAATCGGNDCNDANKKVNPSIAEDCTTVGIDDNCNGQTDEDCEGHFNCVKDGDPCGGKGWCASGHCYWLDDKGYTWTLVPAGTFWMGCNEAVDNDCEYEEKPQHPVNLSAYWIGVYEMTFAVYKGCLAQKFAGCETFSGYPKSDGDDQHALQKLSWAQDRAVCKWLGGDLPSEAQWEKAARGGCAMYPNADCAKSMPTYPWGSSEPIAGKNAAFCESGPGATQFRHGGEASPFGQSPYGAFDMAGNVAEATLDRYDGDFYKNHSGISKDPVNLSDIGGEFRVVRGGSCFSAAKFMRASARSSMWAPSPKNAMPQLDFYTGVRCMRAY